MGKEFDPFQYKASFGRVKMSKPGVNGKVKRHHKKALLSMRISLILMVITKSGIFNTLNPIVSGGQGWSRSIFPYFFHRWTYCVHIPYIDTQIPNFQQQQNF